MACSLEPVGRPGQDLGGKTDKTSYRWNSGRGGKEGSGLGQHGGHDTFNMTGGDCLGEKAVNCKLWRRPEKAISHMLEKEGGREAGRQGGEERL